MTTTTTPSKLLLTMKEGARELRVCTRTVGNMIKAGELPAVRVGGRGVRVDRADLEIWIKNKKEVHGCTAQK